MRDNKTLPRDVKKNKSFDNEQFLHNQWTLSARSLWQQWATYYQ